jgi:hypothetical protein
MIFIAGTYRSNMAKTTTNILQRAEETLYTAKLGLEGLRSNDPRERMAALRNLIVFGRAVTNVLQNLRGIEPEFETWYSPYVAEMSVDPLMKFFYKLRSEILKQGNLQTRFEMSFSGNPHELIKRSQPPPGAKSFFIGDQIGGSGWEVELPDGSKIKYYVAILSDLPNFDLAIKLYFSGAPESLRGFPIEDLCAKYLAYLDKMTTDARKKFRR